MSRRNTRFKRFLKECGWVPTDRGWIPPAGSTPASEKRDLQLAQIASGKTFNEVRQCGTKKEYASQIEAMLAAELMTKQTGKWFNYYHCQYCNGWHVGKRKVYQQQAVGVQQQVTQQ